MKTVIMSGNAMPDLINHAVLHPRNLLRIGVPSRELENQHFKRE
jgi:hypothetical protein